MALRVQFLGQRVRESSNSRSKTIALDAERKRRRQLEESVHGSKHKRTRAIMFAVAAREHLERKRSHVKSSTLRIESKNLDHLLPTFGKLLLNDIEARDISLYQARRCAEGAAGATVNLEMGTLRAILRRHRLWENLRPDVKKCRERDDVGVALTYEQEQRLLAACARSRSRALHPALVLSLNTGLRSSELLKMRWRQVNFAEKTFQVAASKTKAGRDRVIPLNSTAMAAMNAWAAQFPDRRPEHAIFPTEHVGAGGHRFDAMVRQTDPNTAITSLKTAWTTARRLAGVHVRWHDVRHTACTRLLEQGVSIPIVGTIMGWSPSTTVLMVKRYGHPGQTAQRQAVDRLVTPTPANDAAPGQWTPSDRDPQRVH